MTVAGKLIIEVDGATHSTGQEVAYDQRRSRALEALGFCVVRVTNEDVRSNFDGVMTMIWSELNPAEGL